MLPFFGHVKSGARWAILPLALLGVLAATMCRSASDRHEPAERGSIDRQAALCQSGKNYLVVRDREPVEMDCYRPADPINGSTADNRDFSFETDDRFSLDHTDRVVANRLTVEETICQSPTVALYPPGGDLLVLLRRRMI
jgi:hypothetical protein